MVRPGQVILALSNPEPEIEPELARQHGAAYAADGQAVNNVLGFPGIFRGALDAGATRITEEMLLAAALSLADISTSDSLMPDPR
ncbi:MAG: malic enzyme-like NAD(P)-binding protein [Myxococcota bacterium]